MSSILKILVDIQCVVYCDFEEVGEANPYSLFKMELRKGSYIIDFKQDDINLKSIKYKIESDDEDYLLEESLANFYTKEKEARQEANHHHPIPPLLNIRPCIRRASRSLTPRQQGSGK